MPPVNTDIKGFPRRRGDRPLWDAMMAPETAVPPQARG